MNKRKMRDIVWGVILIIVGLLIIGQLAGYLSIGGILHNWWPLILIIPSFIGIFTKGPNWWDVLCAALGIICLAGIRGAISWDTVVKLVTPVIFISIGLSLILQNIIKVGGKRHVVDNFDKMHEDVAFSGKKLVVDTEFHGLDGSASFGGLEVDLRNAGIEEDVSMELLTSFGGIKVYVPQGVNVKLIGNGIFGGCSARQRTNDENAKTIYVNAVALFGGIEVI
ncbi:MAG: cell wall-active antibiotics response protein [Lachnospiraceae bacterium]|nr:cell wall-active antibiotics response protein [Lachnospiraceae bacterium]